MASSFEELRRNRQEQQARLSKALDETSKKGRGNDDPRFWYPTFDKAGNGTAIIRFMPAPMGDDLPYVRQFHHRIKGPTGQWYSEVSPSTWGEDDPVWTFQKKLYDSKDPDNEKLAKSFTRKTTFFTNVWVRQEKANPDVERKTWLYRAGVKIMDKITASMNPAYEEDKPVNPFDLFEGADMLMRVKRVGEFPNYDDSTWRTPGPMLDDDGAMEEAWRACHKLSEFVDKKTLCKSYDELKARFVRVFGFDPDEVVINGKFRYAGPADARRAEDEDTGSRRRPEDDQPSRRRVEQAAPAGKTEASPMEKTQVPDEDDGQTAEDFFANLG
jgi:hypothetical protein